MPVLPSLGEFLKIETLLGLTLMEVSLSSPERTLVLATKGVYLEWSLGEG